MARYDGVVTALTRCPMPLDGSSSAASRRGVRGWRSCHRAGIHQRVGEPLVITFLVIMTNEGSDNLAKGTFTEEDHTVEGFDFHGFVKPLRVGVQVRSLGREENRFYTCTFEHGVESGAQLPVTIDEDIALSDQEAVNGISEIPGDLFHP